MKGPRKFLDKKYLSTLVIAAFLVLSVLTAYHIPFGSDEAESADTEAEETISSSEDVVTSGEVRTENKQEEETGQRNRYTEDDAVKDTETEDTSTETEDTSEEEKESASRFHYDGSYKMSWPVMGNIILPYSMDTTVYYTTLDQYACNEGILIGARKGEEVMASADGRIVNITESDRYGTTMTLLIGENYEVSYSQIDNLKYEIGDEVEEGDVIAQIADPTRSFILEGPHLFFKMTCKGKTVNPTDYLKG